MSSKSTSAESPVTLLTINAIVAIVQDALDYRTTAGDIARLLLDDADLLALINAEVSAVIGAAPGALNTLDELAAALGDDANFAATITTALATKASTTDLTSGLAAKADAAATTTALADKADAAATTTALAGKVDSSTFTENVQDVVGALVVAAGGTYDDPAATIAFPSVGTPGAGTGFTISSSAPVSPTPASGDRWVDDTVGIMYTRTGSLWVEY